MLVNVVDDPGTGDAAQVPAQVVALRLVRRRQGAEALRGESMDLGRLVGLELTELTHVAVRRHHQMAGRVGELVQEHERAVATADDETIFVRARSGETEDAALLLIRLLDVFETPRRPELLRHGAGAYAAVRKRLLICEK